jgi:Tfp pilus assembly protein PilN
MINVLPENEKAKLGKEYMLRLAIVCLLIVTFLSLFASTLLLPTYIVSSSRETSLEGQLEALNKSNPGASLNDLNIFIDKINSTLALFDTKSTDYNFLEDVLSPVLKARPSTTTISQMLFSNRGGDNGAKLELHGVAENRAALQSFKTALEKTNKFNRVDVPISNFVKKTDIDFSIIVYFK